MYQLWINPEKNRIYVLLETIVTGEGESLFKEMKSLLYHLKPGFTAIADIKNFSIQDPEEGIWARKVLDYLAKAGLEKSVRVTGAIPKKGEWVEKNGYKVMLAETIVEANEILDETV